MPTTDTTYNYIQIRLQITKKTSEIETMDCFAKPLCEQQSFWWAIFQRVTDNTNTVLK